VILPQLAATGVEARPIQSRTGWIVTWGPVDARDIPVFLQNRKKTAAMHQVTFGWPQRLEMAVAWAFPVSIIVALLLLGFWRAAALPSMLLTWLLSLLSFLSFPLYAHLLGSRGPGVRRLDFARGPMQLLLWVLCLVGLLAYGAVTQVGFGAWFWRWTLLSLAVSALVTVDLSGSTPTYKSSHQADRHLRVTLDRTRCMAAGTCEQVCPRSCFRVDREARRAEMPGAARCVQCGACIVQCPCDALSFAHPNGGIITPQIVRRFKLNMLGTRSAASDRES
jgi:ferredoxin